MKLTLLGGLYLLLRFIRNVGEKWNFVVRYGPGGDIIFYLVRRRRRRPYSVGVVMRHGRAMV
jgi:hypothetical protein